MRRKLASKEEIKDRSDIVEVIGSFIQLRKRGRNWIGLCPFHQEKTPSFNVDPVTRSFKCFGCGASGDVFTFVEKFENMSFIEAADFLAKRYGMELDRINDAQKTEVKSERELLLGMNAVASEWFAAALRKSQFAQEYLKNRGVAPETIASFQLGYAPDSWDSLSSYLSSKRMDRRIAMMAGLIKARDSEEYYDVFRHRIIFPIHDEQKRIVGFGGRAFGEEQPKYLNTGETPVFVKSRLLYGLPFARRKISTAGYALLMEGYMDVITAHQSGFTHALATLGTSLTEEHAKKLARLTGTIVLVYDADNAGIKATLRSSEILEKEGLTVKVVRLPAGDDPDSLLKRGEIASFQRAIDQAIGRVEFQLDRIIELADQSTESGRARMLRQIIAILASVPTRAERDVYIERVWRYHPLSSSGPSVAKEHLHRDAEAFNGRKAAEKRQPTVSPPSTGAGYGSHASVSNRYNDRFRRDNVSPPQSYEIPNVNAGFGGLTAEQKAERGVLGGMINIETRQSVLAMISKDIFISEPIRNLYTLITEDERYAKSEEADWIIMMEREENFEKFDSIRNILQEFHVSMSNEPITMEYVADCIQTLRKYRVLQLKAELARFLQQKEMWTEEDNEKAMHFQRLIRELKGSGESPTQ